MRGLLSFNCFALSKSVTPLLVMSRVGQFIIDILSTLWVSAINHNLRKDYGNHQYTTSKYIIDSVLNRKNVKQINKYSQEDSKENSDLKTRH